MSKEREGRIHALGTLTEKGFNVVKSAAGERARSAFIVGGNKPIIISTSSTEGNLEFQSHPAQLHQAKYIFAYVLVHYPTKSIYIMPGEDYRKKVEEQVEKGPDNVRIWITVDEKYKDNFKILR